jgi:hypothetical protein
MAVGLTQSLTEMSTRNISWGQRRPVRGDDNLTNFMCRLSWNLGTSNSWNPLGLSRPVMGLLYLYFNISTYSEHMHNSDKLVSQSVVYFLTMTEHFNQVGILHKTNCLRTAGALQSFSKIHIPYFVFLFTFELSL